MLITVKTQKVKCSYTNAIFVGQYADHKNKFLQYALYQPLFPASLPCIVPPIATVTEESNNFQFKHHLSLTKSKYICDYIFETHALTCKAEVKK